MDGPFARCTGGTPKYHRHALNGFESRLGRLRSGKRISALNGCFLNNFCADMIGRYLIVARRFPRMRFVAVRPASGAPTLRPPQEEWEAAAREDRLDFMTASKLLLSESARPRKFGLDFHIVQFVLACLPSFAVYLVALYARSEMTRMEKEREGREVDRGTSHPPPPAVEITDIKARLEAIEDAVKELRCEVSKPTVPKTVEDTNKIPTPTTNPPTAPEAPSVRVA